MDNEGFNQAFWVIQRHITTPPVGVLKGDGYIFDALALIRGVTDGSGFSNAVRRVQTAIKNLRRQTQVSGVIWHECHTISLLANMVKDVMHWQTSFGSAPLKAVAISAGLTMDRTWLHIGPGLPGPAIVNPFLSLMQSLKVPVVFIDAYMMGIYSHMELDQSSKDRYHARATTLPQFGAIFPYLLPPIVHEPLLKKNMDDLAVQTYRLAAAHCNKFDNAVVEQIKRDFRFSKATWWAKRILDHSEFTSEKCKRPVSTHLLNIALNVDAPINFSLTAFPGALLDLGQETSSLIALSCEVDLSGPKLRVSTLPKENQHVYILVARSTRKTIQRLNSDWSAVVHCIIPAGKRLKVDRAIASHWLYMVKVLRKQIDAIQQAKDFAKLKEGEQALFKTVYWMLLNGAMSCISTGTLGSTPAQWWK